MFFITMEQVSCFSRAVMMFFIVTASGDVYSLTRVNQSTFATRIFSCSSSFFCRSFHFWRMCLVQDDLVIQLQAVRLPLPLAVRQAIVILLLFHPRVEAQALLLDPPTR